MKLGTLLLTIVIIGACMPITLQVYAQSSKNVPAYLNPRDVNIKVNIVLDSTFDPSINLDSILYKYTLLSKTSGDSGIGYRAEHHLDYQVTQLTSDQHNQLKTFLLSNANSSTNNGNSLNITAYDSGDLSKVFTPIHGIAFDAVATYNWICKNLWDGMNDTYTLFIFNFQNLDSLFGTEHWFRINPPGIDSNRTSTTFFSNTGTLSSGFQLSGWGGSGSPVEFVDVSSRNWYGNFINEIFKYHDTALSKTIQDLGTINQNSLTFQSWLETWIDAYLDNLFFNLTQTTSVSEMYNAPIYVFYNWTGYTSNQLSWMISENYMLNELHSSFPWMNFTTNVNWYDLNNFPELVSVMKDSITYDTNSKTNVLPIENGLMDYLGQQLLPNMLNVTALRQNSSITDYPTVVILTNGVRFTFGGTQFTGVGDIGYQLIELNSNQAFNTNGTEVAGLTHLILHELGHSLGLLHPFQVDDSWASDFTATLMGYFSNWPHFSIYDQDALGRFFADYYLVQADYLYAQFDTLTNSSVLAVKNSLDQALAYYNQWDFVHAVPAAKHALDLANQVFDLLVGNTSPTPFPIVILIMSSPFVLLIVGNLVHSIWKRKKEAAQDTKQ